MKVIAFYGSPRVKGNTHILLDEALKPIEEKGHEVISFKLNSMNIRPCQNCGGCDKTGKCVIVDDDMQEIYKAIREGDRFIISSPIFFFALSAQTKIMIDRCQAFWAEKYLLKRVIPEGQYGRKGLLLLAGGMKKDIGIKCAETTATAFFRTISVPTHETLAYLEVDAKGEILKHPTALKDAYEAGKRLIEI
ncbi:MAG: flavodoxin family protein [Thermodesulfovibrionales bacterium]|nr:flavodoxin family protein [Thermodesulfovibrionales bacterium]